MLIGPITHRLQQPRGDCAIRVQWFSSVKKEGIFVFTLVKLYNKANIFSMFLLSEFYYTCTCNVWAPPREIRILLHAKQRYNTYSIC